MIRSATVPETMVEAVAQKAPAFQKAFFTPAACKTAKLLVGRLTLEKPAGVPAPIIAGIGDDFRARHEPVAAGAHEAVHGIVAAIPCDDIMAV